MYVDNIIIIGTFSMIEKLIYELFSLKYLGALLYFIGVEAYHPYNGPNFFLSQRKYISDLLTKEKLLIQSCFKSTFIIYVT